MESAIKYTQALIEATVTISCIQCILWRDSKP